jgi:hypothetical protein
MKFLQQRVEFQVNLLDYVAFSGENFALYLHDHTVLHAEKRQVEEESVPILFCASVLGHGFD